MIYVAIGVLLCVVVVILARNNIKRRDERDDRLMNITIDEGRRAAAEGRSERDCPYRDGGDPGDRPLGVYAVIGGAPAQDRRFWWLAGFRNKAPPGTLSQAPVAAPDSPPLSAAAEIDADLQAEPGSRERMNLLWFASPHLSQWRALAAEPDVEVVRGAANANPEIQARADRVFADIREGRLTTEDFDWAMATDTIAEEAEAAGRRGDLLDAIRLYRKALRRAPGTDVYIMSIGSCYGMLGLLPVAVRYHERAAEISPDSERIQDNLEETRNEIEQGY